MLTLAAFGVLATADASAQDVEDLQVRGMAHPGEDVLTIELHGGALFSASSFAGGARFDDTGAWGLTATFWAHENLGIRANGLWANPAVLEGADEVALFGQDPNVFHYSGDVVLRMPMQIGPEMSWYPYLVAGVGGKTYDFETAATDTDLAGNVGLGLALRFGELGRWGVHTEVRDFLSNFERLGVDETLHDVIWTGGISVNF